MVNWNMWLRWSWRDLRARWLQVTAIAMIIALGTGVFAGLGGQEKWRVDSLDESYERLNMYDLRLKFNDDTYVDQAEFEALGLEELPGVEALETRLVTQTQVDASENGDDILVQGLLIGVDVAAGNPVNTLYVPDGNGRLLADTDIGPEKNIAVLEWKFADHHGLEPGATLELSGGHVVDLVGAVHSPEYFQIIPEEGFFIDDSEYAVVFVPLATAQRLTQHPGDVNNVAFLLEDGADAAAVQAEVESRVSESFPARGFEIDLRDDDPVAEILYSDAENDQVTWNTVAFLFLIGASLGAFNLAGRIVEAQRRQIGIGMALGVPRRWIAFRPLLVGFQIAVLGTIFGLGVGVGLSLLFSSLFETLLPLPYWDLSFYVPGFIRATLLGVLLPFLATLIPVWRAVRVPPIDAIQSGHLVAKGGGLSWVTQYVPIPGKSFSQMPVKNLLRSPWRTVLTMFGIAMAIALLTMFVGFLDTFVATIEQAEDAYLHEGADRLIINLNSFYPSAPGMVPAVDAEVQPGGDKQAVDSDLLVMPDPVGDLVALAQGDNPLLAAAPETALFLGGRLIAGDTDLEVALELHDMATAIWRPDLVDGSLTLESGEPGIIISEKAAEDLGLSVGDTVQLEHPQQSDEAGFTNVVTEVTVSGIHNNPLRALTYMDSATTDFVAERLQIQGVTNYLVVQPADGVSGDDVKRVLFEQHGVAAVQEIADISEAVDEALKIFTQVLRIIQAVVVFMAFLIAFNSTSISVDERVREIATMFAFGLRIRTVTRMQMVENLITGTLGTLIGMGMGWIMLNAMLVARIEEQLADFKFEVTVAPLTLLVSLLLGVLTVGLTPLFSIRRMRKMDIPSTLRVME
ncbi:MAG: FtsX-like permease family protein [Chloroflexi bacterium]|nr:FtsX-like permease family protein [Chloroflexota bacterium]